MEKEVNDLLKEKFLCQGKFSQDIEQLVLNSELNYIEAIVSYCEENNIELDSVSKLISKPLKEKLKSEAMELNFLKKTSKAKLLCNPWDTQMICSIISPKNIPRRMTVGDWKCDLVSGKSRPYWASLKNI